MRDYTKELIEFIHNSPSCYHVVENIAKQLTENGFAELREGEKWNLKKGGNYYVRRNLSTVIAFKVPQEEICGFQIAASHSDSPTFKIKENMDIVVDGSYTRLNVEKYGGMICAPWFDRPLSVAGKVVVRQDGKLVSRLVNIDRDLMMIPNLAIHMNRAVNDGYKYSAQGDMLPLLGDETAKGKFMDLVAENVGVKKEDILGTDLFLYCRQKGTVWGADGEYVSSPKLDDLQCTYANLQGFLQGGHPKTLSVYAVFDNEEVGSGTKQGAASTVLLDVLSRINESLGRGKEEYLMALASGFMISADNAHAVHPNHVSAADPTNHPHMNQGIVIKFSGNQKYCTDSVSAALFREICARADVPTQVFHNHSDILGGSTLGNLSNAQVSLNMVDIGLAQLAMHSPYETAGTKDTEYLVRAMKAFYNSFVEESGSGLYTIHTVE